MSKLGNYINRQAERRPIDLAYDFFILLKNFFDDFETF